MELKTITERYNLDLVVSFGSWNTARFSANSDIDLAYLSHESLSLKRESELLNDFVYYFRQERLDLVDLKKAAPLLLFEIATKGKVLFEREDIFLRFKLRASARYAETGFLRKMRHEYLNRI